MKNITKLAIITALGLTVGGLTIAQAHRSGALGHMQMAEHHGDPASMVQHIAEVFPQIAAFDVNKNGKLDDAEKEALGRAIADGTLELPAHSPPDGVKPTAEMMVNHIAEMYSAVTAYDVNHDGQLEDQEQAALKSAIEKGEFAPFSQHPHDSGLHN